MNARAITHPLLSMLVVVGSLASCTFGNCVKGTGAVEEVRLSLEPFQGIVLQGSMDVELTSDREQGVVVEAQTGLAELLETTVHDGVWHIRTKECFSNSKPFVIRIATPGLNKVHVQGSGNVVSKGTLTTEGLDVHVHGSGDIQLEATTGTVKAVIQGSGDIVLAGECRDLEAVVQGSGDIKASGMQSTAANAVVQGSGDITVNTTGPLKAKIMGSGDIKYLGQPVSIDSDVQGSGSITKL